MQFAVTFGRLRPDQWVEAAVLAESLGFESIWLPEHMVFTVKMAGSPHEGEAHPPVPPETPLFDVGSLLSFVAARTSTIRLGTYVYLLGLRHPFISARTFATVDWLSGGRVIVGAGAGWLLEEWEALGIDPTTRGARLNEAIDVCRRLWTEPTVANDGTFFPFPEVAFEPKPAQQPIPILVGGESAPALRRAGQRGDGWIGMSQTPESVVPLIATLRAHREAAGRLDRPFDITVGGSCTTEDDAARWEAAGVNRLIVTPWARARDAFGAMETFAGRFLQGSGI